MLVLALNKFKCNPRSFGIPSLFINDVRLNWSERFFRPDPITELTISKSILLCYFLPWTFSIIFWHIPIRFSSRIDRLDDACDILFGSSVLGAASPDWLDWARSRFWRFNFGISNGKSPKSTDVALPEVLCFCLQWRKNSEFYYDNNIDCDACLLFLKKNLKTYLFR